VVIREESPRDHAAIRVLYRAVFGREDESQLVDRLRDDGMHVVSLIAVDEADEGAELVGHVLFSEVRIETQKGLMLGAALAPIGVRASRQKTGIGSELIKEGFVICRERGRVAVLVLGDPKYYSRFGFRAEPARRLMSPYSDAGKNWMAAELVPGALKDVYGLVRYPDAFEGLER
jgi:putative acetyltransferase